MTTTSWVERPPHVDETRMRHISDGELLAALATGRPELAAVHSLAATGDTTAAIATLRRQLSVHGHRPVWDPVRWAAAARGGPRARDRIAEADRLLETDVDFLDRSRGTSALYGLHYLDWMTPLTDAYCLTGDARYAAGWDRLFSTWYRSRDRVVGEIPGLDVIWYSLGVQARSANSLAAAAAFGREPALSDAVYAELLKTVLGGARWAAQEHIEFRHGNWQLVCVAELVHAAGTLPEFAESEHWAQIGWSRLIEHLDRDFYVDGGHRERSPEYHEMCLDALQRAAVTGERYLGRRMCEHPRFEAAHEWLAGLTTPGGWIPHPQDGNLVWPARQLLRGWYFFGTPHFKTMAQRWLDPQEIAEVLAVLPTNDGTSGSPAERFESAPAMAGEPRESARAHQFASGYTVLRGGWEPDDLTTLVNHGPHVSHELQSHSHNAALDFVISGWGQALAWEAGGPLTYDDPAYHDWFQATRAHNTVELTNEALSPGRHCEMQVTTTCAELDVLDGSHDGYSRRHCRRILFVRASPSYWLISDTLGAASAPSATSEAVWRIHGRAPWSPYPGGHASIDGPGLVVLPVDVSAPPQWHRGPARIPDPVSRTAPFGEIFGLGLRQELHAEQAAQFDVVLLPFATRAPAGWRACRVGEAVEISLGKRRDLMTASRWQRFDADGTLLHSIQIGAGDD